MDRRTGAALAALIGIAAAAAAQEQPGDGGGARAPEEPQARPTAREGFAEIRRAAAERDASALRVLLPERAVAGWTDLAKSRAALWRLELAERLAQVEPSDVRESGDRAFVRWIRGAPPVTWELPIACDGTRWSVDAPFVYCVRGGSVAVAGAKGAGRVKLAVRTDRTAYGASAFSFRHVTQDPAQCRNRMDVWCCENGDLHFRGATRAAATLAEDLSRIDGVPSDVKWLQTLTPRRDTVVVVRCLAPGRADFYVAMRATSVSAAGVEFEWRVVADGVGAPKSQSTPQPLPPRDAKDAAKDPDDPVDAFCAKRTR